MIVKKLIAANLHHSKPSQMTGYRAPYSVAACLALLGVILAAFEVISVGSTVAVYNLRIDADTYLPLAKQVAKGGLAAIPITQPPGFISYLAVIELVGGNAAKVTKYLNVLWLGLTVWLTFIVAIRISSRTASLVACGLVALSPLLRAYCATAQYEVLSALLIMASIACVFKARDRFSAGWIIVAGCVAALSALTRETALLFVPIYAIALQARPKALSLYLAVALLPIVVWIGYQYLNHGVLAPISSKGDINLSIGFNPNANGTYHGTMKPPVEPMGIEFIKQHPLASVKLALKKLLILWGFESDGWNVPRLASLALNRLSWGALDYGTVVAITRCALSVLCIIGAWLVFAARGYRRVEWLLAAVILLIVSAIHLAFISSARFIVPVLPLVYLFAAVPIAWALSYLSRSRALMMALLGYLVAVNLFPGHRLKMLVELEDTDGFDVLNVSCSNCSGAAARSAPARPEKRLASLWSDNYLPTGRYAIRIVCAGDSLELKPLSVIGYGKRREVLFQAQAKPSSLEAGILEAQVSIAATSSVALAIRVAEDESCLLDRAELIALPKSL
jgi:hypothetical protein